MTVFEKHQKRIAIQTLKMHDVGAMIMGGTPCVPVVALGHGDARA